MWKSSPSRLKMTWTRLADGTRPVMRECYGPERFEFYEKNKELEVKIFGKSDIEGEEDIDLLLIERYHISTEKIQDNKERKQNNVEEDTPKLSDDEMEEEEDDDINSPFVQEEQKDHIEINFSPQKQNSVNTYEIRPSVFVGEQD